MSKETVKSLYFFLKIAVPVGAGVALSFGVFSRETKAQTLVKRGERCQRCQKKTGDLYPHHRLPSQFGGADNEDNLLWVCKDCHPKLDTDALTEGVLDNGTLVEEVAAYEPEIIGNRSAYQKVAGRFIRLR